MGMSHLLVKAVNLPCVSFQARKSQVCVAASPRVQPIIARFKCWDVEGDNDTYEKQYNVSVAKARLVTWSAADDFERPDLHPPCFCLSNPPAVVPIFFNGHLLGEAYCVFFNDISRNFRKI